MIGKIIDALSAVSPEVGRRFGLCEKRGDTVFQYVGGGNGEQINVDQNGTWSYFRITGRITRKRDNTYRACDGWLYALPIRYVLVTRRDGSQCSGDQGILSASASFISARRAIERSLSALNVIIQRSDVETDSARAFANEVGQGAAPLEIVFQYADLSIEILLDHECVDFCGPSGSILCELIRGATIPQIQACLTDQQITALCDLDCEDGAITNSNASYNNTVASGGVLVLSDITHTDSDGSPAVRPAMVPFIATPCSTPSVDFYYPIAIGHP